MSDALGYSSNDGELTSLWLELSVAEGDTSAEPDTVACTFVGERYDKRMRWMDL